MTDDLRRYLKTAIFFLLMWALFCLLLSIVTGCNTSKHTMVKHSDRDSLSVFVNGIRFDRSWIEQFKADSSWQNDYWHYVIYDTSKPIDSVTNLPPVLADVRHKKEAGTKQVEKTLQTDTSTVISQTSIEEGHSEDDEIVEDTKSEVKTIPAWRVWLFTAFVILILIMVFAGKDVVYKITTSLLNKIFK